MGVSVRFLRRSEVKFGLKVVVEVKEGGGKRMRKQ